MISELYRTLKFQINSRQHRVTNLKLVLKTLAFSSNNKPNLVHKIPRIWENLLIKTRQVRRIRDRMIKIPETRKILLIILVLKTPVIT